MLLDGPHGSFSARPHADRIVLIAGGIGITPIISLLRSAADARDRRPFVLVYGSLRWEEATFREELARLEQSIDLRVVHVLTDPHPGMARRDWLHRRRPAPPPAAPPSSAPPTSSSVVRPPCSPRRSIASNASEWRQSTSTPSSS